LSEIATKIAALTDGDPRGLSEGVRSHYSLRIKIGALEFSRLKGDFVGTPVISLNTRQFSEIEFTLNNKKRQEDQITPEGDRSSSEPVTEQAPEQLSEDLWEQILANEGAEVQVELGYAPDHLQNVLVGKLYRIGRKLPDGVILEVMDQSAQLANTTRSSVNAKGETPVISKLKPDDLSADAFTLLPVADETDLGTAQLQVRSFGETARIDLGLNSSSGITPLPTETTGENSRPATSPLVEKAALESGLRFVDQSGVVTSEQGTAAIASSSLNSASQQAGLLGEVLIASGNTIKQVAAGKGDTTGLILDWVEHQSAFVGNPVITKKTPLQLQSGYGALTVQGWSPNDKAMMGATVVTTPPVGVHPTGNIQVPEWGNVKLGEAIAPGSLYTWGDATRQGERVPESNDVMQGIVLAAGLMDEISKKYLGGQKVQITSWYRDPASNEAVSSSGRSGPHTTGSAVDFYTDNMDQIHADYERSWEGGVAISPGSFVHLDGLGVFPGLEHYPKLRRWQY
jgi:hypothetical protein